MRCYNGCPDKELQALLDSKEKAHKDLSKIGCRATYFPMEGKWLVFKGLDIITDFFEDVRDAAAAAFKKLEIKV